MEKEMAVLIDTLDAAMVANRQKAMKLASRFAAVSERMARARETSVPDLELIEAGREVLEMIVARTDNDRRASLLFAELFAVNRFVAATTQEGSTPGEHEAQLAAFYAAMAANHKQSTELASRFAAVWERMAETTETRGADLAREVLELLVAIMDNWREASLLAAGSGEGLGSDPTAPLFEEVDKTDTRLVLVGVRQAAEVVDELCGTDVRKRLDGILTRAGEASPQATIKFVIDESRRREQAE